MRPFGQVARRQGGGEAEAALTVEIHGEGRPRVHPPHQRRHTTQDIVHASGDRGLGARGGRGQWVGVGDHRRRGVLHEGQVVGGGDVAHQVGGDQVHCVRPLGRVARRQGGGEAEAALIVEVHGEGRPRVHLTHQRRHTTQDIVHASGDRGLGARGGRGQWVGVGDHGAVVSCTKVRS